MDGNGFSGLPGFYGDNTGQVLGTFQIQTVPEPAGALLMCLGLVFAAGLKPAAGKKGRG